MDGYLHYIVIVELVYQLPATPKALVLLMWDHLYLYIIYIQRLLLVIIQQSLEAWWWVFCIKSICYLLGKTKNCQAIMLEVLYIVDGQASVSVWPSAPTWRWNRSTYIILLGLQCLYVPEKEKANVRMTESNRPSKLTYLLGTSQKIRQASSGRVKAIATGISKVPGTKGMLPFAAAVISRSTWEFGVGLPAALCCRVQVKKNFLWLFCWNAICTYLKEQYWNSFVKDA